jgi:hypothetical protein
MMAPPRLPVTLFKYNLRHKVSTNSYSPSPFRDIFKQLWRVPENEFQLRCLGDQFLSSNSEDCLTLATASKPLSTETFYIQRNGRRVHIKLLNGGYVQVALSSICINSIVLYVSVPS